MALIRITNLNGSSKDDIAALQKLQDDLTAWVLKNDSKTRLRVLELELTSQPTIPCQPSPSPSIQRAQPHPHTSSTSSAPQPSAEQPPTTSPPSSTAHQSQTAPLSSESISIPSLLQDPVPKPKPPTGPLETSIANSPTLPSPQRTLGVSTAVKPSVKELSTHPAAPSISVPASKTPRTTSKPTLSSSRGVTRQRSTKETDNNPIKPRRVLKPAPKKGKLAHLLDSQSTWTPEEEHQRFAEESMRNFYGGGQEDEVRLALGMSSDPFDPPVDPTSMRRRKRKMKRLDTMMAKTMEEEVD